MDIHKPKPVHNLSEFASEIGIIVIGVLIALSFEQAVEWLHWRHEVNEGRERLREEVAVDERVYVHRVDVAGCVARNLHALKAVVADLRAHKPVAPIAEIAAPANGPIRHEIWSSLTAAQVMVHFPKAELTGYSQFYQDIQDAEYFMDRESRAWAQLKLLEGDPNQLSPADISAIRIALGDAEETSRDLASVVGGQVRVGRMLGVAVPGTNTSWRPECRPMIAA